VVLYISLEGGPLLNLCSTSPDSAFPVEFRPGENIVDCDFPSLMLSAGLFTIGAGLAIPDLEWLDNHLDAGTLQIDGQDVFGSGLAPVANRYPVAMPHSWRIPAGDDLLPGEPEKKDLVTAPQVVN
jgi:hypothetical protein